MNLSIVIPVFNEEDNVVPLCQRCKAVMADCRDISNYEIILVDDGSTDATPQRLISMADARLKIVSLGTRQGQSAAFAQGIRVATFDTIATLDGDLQNDPSDFSKMFLSMREGADFVQGWRYPRRDPISKKISSFVANHVRRWILKDSFHDIACSQRIFKKKCIQEIDFFSGAHRFLPYLVQEAGYKVVECRVNHHSRVAGISKYGILNRMVGPVRDLIRLSKLRRQPS